MGGAVAVWRIPAIVAPGVVAAALGGALVLLRVPVETSALGAVVATLIVAAAVWALVDLERFVLVAVLGAMILPAALVQPGSAQVAAVDVLLVVALGAWLVRGSVQRSPAPYIAGNRLLAPALLFIAVTAASLAWSVTPSETVKTIIQMIEIVVVLPLVFASLPRSVGAIRGGLLVYVGLTCILAVVTFALFAPRAGAGDLTAQYLPGLHKNAIGSALAAGLVLAYGFSLVERIPRVRRVLGLAVLIELAGLAATISRGALLGALLGVIAVSLLLGRGRLLTLGLVVVVAIAFVLTVGVQPGAGQAQPGGFESSSVREYSFGNAVDKIAERPLLGSGAGTYWDYIPQLNIGLADPNNLFLLTWAEIGIMGLGTLIFLLWRFGGLLVEARRLPEAAAVPAVAAGGVVLSLLVHFQVDSTWNRGTASLAFAMMGLMLAARRLAPRPGGSPRESATPAAPAVEPPAAPAVEPPAAPAVEPPAAPEMPAAAADEPPPLRVLHVVTSSAYAGIERHVVRLLRELRTLGCMAELACPPSADRLRAEAVAAGIPVHPPAGSRPRAWIGAVAQHVAAEPPAIIHLHDGRSALAGMLLGPLGRGLVVRTQHFTHPASAQRRGWRRDASLGLHRALNRKLNGYVAVSQSVAAAAAERNETRDSEVVVIPPGIELPGAGALALARAVRGGQSHPAVAYIGRLEAEKRLEVLLRAVPRVLNELPSCRFIIAGSGAAEEGLRRLARRLEVDAAITWTGEVAQPASVLEGAHVYVSPSPAEGFGLAVAEAMAYALPVVAVASGGSAEIVDDGVTGLLVPPGDDAALAAAIVRLAGDLPQAAQIGLAARRRAGARFGVDLTARATLDFYRRLLGVSRR